MQRMQDQIAEYEAQKSEEIEMRMKASTITAPVGATKMKLRAKKSVNSELDRGGRSKNRLIKK